MSNINLTKKSNEKYDFIDLIKALAIYFVVIYHFNNIPIDFIGTKDNGYYLNYFLKSILSTCVPLFFFVNGALLLNKKELDIKRHAFKILNITGLIIIWGVISLIALAYIRNEKLSFFDIIKGVYTLRQGWIEYLWFLEALIVIYIFFPIFFSTFKNNLKYFYFFFISVMVLTFGNTFLSSCAVVASFFLDKFTSTNLSINFFGDFNAFRGLYGYSIGYFLLGGILFYYKDLVNTKKFRTMSIIAIPLAMILLFLYGVIVSKRQNHVWDVVWNGYDSIFTLINVVSIYILSLQYKSKGIIGKGIKMIGENSLGIYFLHIIIGSILFPVFLETTFATTFLANIIFAFTVLAFSLLIVIGLKKTPIIKHLFLIN
jgi:surface polysaccharide O-acyltransferase-like enzyme